MVDDLLRRSFIVKAIYISKKFIDLPSAVAGSIFMGLIVFFINYRYGAWPATTAALKQAAYTFIFGGVIIRLLYGMVKNIPGKITGLVLPVIITSILTISLVYLLHSLKGTPLPVQSTLPTVFLAPPGFFFLALRKKRRKSVFKRSAD